MDVLSNIPELFDSSSIYCYNMRATAMVSYESGQVGNEAALRKLYHVR